jgi:uncharacterized protein YbjT (DUF2867 family)
MPTEERAALVLGATGLIGSALLNQLLDSSGFAPVTALLRRPSGRSHPRLLERVTDFTDLDALDVPAPTAVFCVLGTTIKVAGSQAAFRQIDYDLPLRLARWARSRGASHFLLVSSVGADPQSPSPYLRVKGDLERDLASLGYPALDIFQPSVLLGPRAGFRPAEWISKVALQAVPFLLLGPLRKYRAIRGQDVAAAMLAASQTPTPGVRRHEYDSILNLAARAR